MRILMDYYADTPYDLSQGIAAGAWGVPVRFDGPSYNITGSWERPISHFRTMYSFVAESRSDFSDDLGGVIWYGQSSPHGSVYVPFSCAQESIPPSYLIGKESKFTTDSSWWAFDFVNNWSYLRYNIISKDIKLEQERLQEEAFAHSEKVRQVAASIHDRKNRTRFMEQEYNAFAQHVVQEWWQLAWNLVSKFSDGWILVGEGPNDMTAPGYPEWFLQTTSFSSWPGTSYNPPLPLRSLSLRSENHMHHGPSFMYGALFALSLVGLFVLACGLYGKYKQRQGYKSFDSFFD